MRFFIGLSLVLLVIFCGVESCNNNKTQEKEKQYYETELKRLQDENTKLIEEIELLRKQNKPELLHLLTNEEKEEETNK